MREYGPWGIKSSAEIYADPWITVRRDEVQRPDGLPGTHCVVNLKAGVSVLAVGDDGLVHLTEEFHYAVGRVGLEAVSGGIDAGETPIDAARRELREEMGIEAARWTPMGVIDPFTSVVLSPTALFIAEGLTFGTAAPEATEQIRHVTMPLAEALEQVREGGITHGPSCVLILRYVMERRDTGVGSRDSGVGDGH